MTFVTLAFCQDCYEAALDSATITKIAWPRWVGTSLARNAHPPRARRRHGAPGGQTGTNIDNSPHGRPDLFLEPGNAELTVQLWTDFARHFAGHHTVRGYDLLNEPLPHEWRFSLTSRLVDLYQRLTHAIRDLDQDHLIVYEGTHWATDFSMFTQRWDHQQVLQFHRYWSSPDREGIAPFIEARDRLDMPLYMGEGGENTPE